MQDFNYSHQSVIWNKPDYVYEEWTISLRAQMIKIKFPSFNMPLVAVEQIPNKRLQPFQIWWMDSFAVCPKHGQKPSISIHSTINNFQSQSPRVAPKYSWFSWSCSPYQKTKWHATNYFSSHHENKLLLACKIYRQIKPDLSLQHRYIFQYIYWIGSKWFSISICHTHTHIYIESEKQNNLGLF